MWTVGAFLSRVTTKSCNFSPSPPSLSRRVSYKLHNSSCFVAMQRTRRYFLPSSTGWTQSIGDRIYSTVQYTAMLPHCVRDVKFVRGMLWWCRSRGYITLGEGQAYNLFFSLFGWPYLTSLSQVSPLILAGLRDLAIISKRWKRW